MRALDSIIRALDIQVGKPMMMTNSHCSQKEQEEFSALVLTLKCLNSRVLKIKHFHVVKSCKKQTFKCFQCECFFGEFSVTSRESSS